MKSACCHVIWHFIDNPLMLNVKLCA